MHCPSCVHEFSDRHPKCPECGFHLSQLAQRWGRPPPPRGHLLDSAGLLDVKEEAELLGRIATLMDETEIECCVVTLQATAPLKPAEMAFWLVNHWAVGGPEHRGLLVLLALDERRVEVEVGYGLEPVLPDSVADAILEQTVVPLLSAGQVVEGLDVAVVQLGDAIRTALHAASDTPVKMEHSA